MSDASTTCNEPPSHSVPPLEKTLEGNSVGSLHPTVSKLPVKPGKPAALYLPLVPAFRKGLRRQEKLCLFQPLRNGGTAGAYNKAGLPGIVGDFYNLITNNPTSIPQMGYAHGCFYTPAKTSFAGNITGVASSAQIVVAETGDGIQMDASRSAIAYGGADTVMPSSVDVLVGLYLGCQA